MLKWILKINFISPFLEVITGTATLVDVDFKEGINETLVVLEIKIEPGSTGFKTISWKKGHIYDENVHEFLRDQLHAYHYGLRMDKECHFWVVDYIKQGVKNDLSKIKKDETRNKKKTKDRKRAAKEITRITKNKKQ
jgi:hypothetical protein